MAGPLLLSPPAWPRHRRRPPAAAPISRLCAGPGQACGRHNCDCSQPLLFFHSPLAATHRTVQCLHLTCRRAAGWAAASSATGAALLASTPYILSHPLGLKAALALVNAAAPATIQVQAVTAGWGSPLHVYGLQVLERCDGAATAAKLAAAPRGRLLLSVGHLRTEQSLFQLLMAACTHSLSGEELPAEEAIQLAASHVAVDCSLREDGQLRLGHLLRRARLIAAAPDPPASPSAATAASHGSSLASTAANGTSERSRAGRIAGWPPASCLYPQCPLGFSGTLVLARGALQVQLSDGTLHVPLEVG